MNFSWNLALFYLYQRNSNEIWHYFSFTKEIQMKFSFILALPKKFR